MDFQCPNCDTTLEVADTEFEDQTERKVDCPECDEPLIVHANGTAETDEEEDDYEDDYEDDE